MNQVILIGRLARDPELSYTPNTQTAVCRFTLAVDRPRRQGEDAGADFIRIIVWGNQAETSNRYLSKGRQAAVMGRIETGSYTNRDGQTVYTTDVVAERVEFLGGRNADNSENRGFNARNDGNRATGRSVNENATNRVISDVKQAAEQWGIGGAFKTDLPDSFAAAEDDIPF